MTRAAALLLSLALAGCATWQNPIQRSQLAEIESGYGIALSAAVGYRDLCEKKIIARATCAPIVAKLQAADRRVQVALDAAGQFIVQNPTLDASSFISAARTALQAFQSVQSSNGVK